MWKGETTVGKTNENFVDLCCFKECIIKNNCVPASTETSLESKVLRESPAEHMSHMSPKQDAVHLRLQKDLDSPSAFLRVRALRALKSPSKTTYNKLYVSHAEQSIITTSERHPSSPVTVSEILRDVIVYVEVRTGNDNRSEGVKTIIAKLGAKVNDRFLRNTTHVVFKDGLLSTYKRAQSWNIPIVSILWIEACKVQRRLCEPKQFPISNIHIYEYPELYGKLTRVRCMQPDSELNKRPRKKLGTPTGAKDKDLGKKLQISATPPSTSTNDITRFFKPLSQKPNITEDDAAESPATKLLNRIGNGFFTPQPFKEYNGTPNEDIIQIKDRVEEKPPAKKISSFNQDKQNNKPRSSSFSVEPAHLCTSVRRSRRHSSVQEPTAKQISEEKMQSDSHMTHQNSLLSASAKKNSVHLGTEPEPRMTRRRTSLQISASPIVNASLSIVNQDPRVTRRRSISTFSTVEAITPKALKNTAIESIAEEPLIEKIINGKSDYIRQSLDIKSKKPTVNETNNAQESMELSTPRERKRRTVYTTNSMDLSDNENIHPYLKYQGSKNTLENGTAQTFFDSRAEQTPVPILSSTRLLDNKISSNRRGTLLSVDMDLINQSTNKINYTSQIRLLTMPNETELSEGASLVPPQSVAMTEDKTNKEQSSSEPKMRRLFTPNVDVVVTPPKSTKQSRQSISKSSSTNSLKSTKQSRQSISKSSSTNSLKRRRTLGTSKPTAAVGPNLPFADLDNTESDVHKDVCAIPYGSDAIFDNSSEVHTECSHSPSPKRHAIYTLVHTNMHKDQIQVITKAIRKLRGMRLDPTVTKRTTHLVSLEPRRTVNLLRGLMRGVWIVSYKWILESVRVGKWVNEEKYELTSFSRAVEICRTERQAFGISYRCELFRYMETFYVSPLCKPITFNNIKELLLLGGAKISENRYKAKFIIGDKRRAEDDRIYLSPTWVLDSITAMQIQKFSKYFMKCAIITPFGIRYENPREEAEEKHRRNLKICYKDPGLVINK